jgi:acetyltransferase-like isoleucine patch superfamily enzyme
MELINLVQTIAALAVTQTYWRIRLGALGARSILHRPMLVSNPRFIRVGSRTSIRDGARLEALYRKDVPWQPEIRIGDRVNIEQGCHIVAHCLVDIGNDVSITPYCVIVDTDHPFDPPDGSPKIGARLPAQPSHVRIGDGTFVGAHSIILPDVSIGRHCVIAAGSVVTRNVPDYSLVRGSPARVVKTFDTQNRVWLAAM